MRLRLTVAVYPCVYREHVWFLRQQMKYDGLSLCIQGTFVKCPPVFLISRFIPVYTGNIAKFLIDRLNSAVYPCVYREHFNIDIIILVHPGLSLCIQGTYLF